MFLFSIYCNSPESFTSVYLCLLNFKVSTFVAFMKLLINSCKLYFYPWTDTVYLLFQSHKNGMGFRTKM